MRAARPKNAGWTTPFASGANVNASPSTRSDSSMDTPSGLNRRQRMRTVRASMPETSDTLITSCSFRFSDSVARMRPTRISIPVRRDSSASARVRKNSVRTNNWRAP